MNKYYKVTKYFENHERKVENERRNRVTSFPIEKKKALGQRASVFVNLVQRIKTIIYFAKIYVVSSFEKLACEKF